MRWHWCLGAALAMLAAHGAAPELGPARAQDLDMEEVFRCHETPEVPAETCNEARSLILDNCTTCHAFVPIVLQQFDAEGWNGLLDRHRPRVPQLSDEQIETIGAYLAANFNPDYEPPELPPELLEQWTDY